MRVLGSIATLGLVCVAGVAAADTGLKVDAAGGFWYGAQSRLHVVALRTEVLPFRLGYRPSQELSAPAPWAASLSGDYYFSAQITDAPRPRSGFRASSALLIREPGISLSDLAWSTRSSSTFGAATPLGLPNLALGPTDASAYSVSAMPYVGLGYSDYSLKNGWGFWADVGLVVQSPGNAVGVGRVLFGAQSAEELMRELRMAPMVQLGVNYSF
jgi:hypothetical protein